MKNQKGNVTLIILVVILCLLGMGSCAYFVPQYKAYARQMEGQGELDYRNLERQAMVAQAQAEKDSAVLRAQAIEIIGEAAKKYPEYRQQEFIGAFASCLERGCAQQIIYVPTEANIPITESVRLKSLD